MDPLVLTAFMQILVLYLLEDRNRKEGIFVILCNFTSG
jgi:hypothetical protein